MLRERTLTLVILARLREHQVAVPADRQAIEAYWASLTPEQQAELDTASTAEAEPDILAMQSGPLKSMATTLRRHTYIRKLLANREQTATPAPANAASSDA